MTADWVMEISFHTPTAHEIAQEKQKNYDFLLAQVQDCIIHKKNMDEIFSVNPLHIAAADDFYLPISQLLLLNNADPNRRDLLGKTPLMEAAEHLSVKTIKLLLEKGADPNAKENFTPLYLICNAANDPLDSQKAAARISAATHLLESGANPNMKSHTFTDMCEDDEQTPLHALTSSSFENNRYDSNPITHKIIIKNRKKLIKLLLKYGANLSITTESNLTPLEKAKSLPCFYTSKNRDACNTLADFALSYLQYSRRKLVTRVLLRPYGNPKFSPFMQLPKEIVKMIVFMVYPSHKK